MARAKNISPGLRLSPDSILYTSWDSRIGPIHAAATPKGICRIELGEFPGFAGFLEKTYHVKPYRQERPFGDLKGEMEQYLRGQLLIFNTPLVFLEGTAFYQKIWNALREIPYGQTQSYAWIAEKTGHPRAFRAVGQACGRNPVPILLPCHRVIATGGGLGGYTGGIPYKKWLLGLEQNNRQNSATGFD